jgi:hypothetical protein
VTSTVSSARGRNPIKPLMIRSVYPLGVPLSFQIAWRFLRGFDLHYGTDYFIVIASVPFQSKTRNPSVAVSSSKPFANVASNPQNEWRPIIPNLDVTVSNLAWMASPTQALIESLNPRFQPLVRLEALLIVAANSASDSGGITEYSIFRGVNRFFLASGAPSHS